MKQVADWEYDGNECVLYDSGGEVIDKIHLDELVKDWVNKHGSKLGYEWPSK